MTISAADLSNTVFHDSAEGYLRHPESGSETILSRGRSQQQGKSFSYPGVTSADTEMLDSVLS